MDGVVSYNVNGTDITPMCVYSDGVTCVQQQQINDLWGLTDALSEVIELNRRTFKTLLQIVES